MKRRIVLVVLVVMILSMFSGCDFLTQKLENLLVPPTLTEEQNNIDIALKKAVGGTLNLVYPKNGEYRSAYVVSNIDSEESNEAIVFYKEESDTTSSVRVNVLDQKNGEWVSTHDESSVTANGVDKLSFVEVKDKIYIIIGFTISGTTDKNLVVYTYDSEALIEVFSGKCVDYEVYDLDTDKTPEIVMLVNTVLLENQKETVAKLFKIENGQVILEDTTYMDSATTSYLNIFKGYVDNKTPALFLDGQKSTDTVATEILSLNKYGKLQNLSYSEKLNLMQPRSIELPCMDINSDGIYDIPQKVLFPGYSSTNVTDGVYKTNWYNYKNGQMELIKTTYTDYHLDCSFILPEKWLVDNKVTAKIDSNKNQVIFYLYDNKLMQIEEELLELRVFTVSELDKGRLPSTYEYLHQNGILIYAYKKYNTQTDYDISTEEISKNFKLVI